MSDVYLVQKELYHHGIKGQKWGVRRFQKKDGSLTPAGKKRYGLGADGNKTTAKPKSPSAHRVALEKKYRDKGMSAEEAAVAAAKRIKVEKVVAATAGLTVATCAAYYAKNKFTATYCDQVLKAGTTFHNLDATANNRPDQHLYVNYRQNDINYFRGNFALGKLRKTGHVFNHTITANEDIKIPSLNTRKNVFKQLYDNDPDFRKAFAKHSASSTSDSAAKVYKNMWMKFGDKNTPEFNEAKRKYFEALRQKGYEAIVDEWDTSKGVFRADAPLILLNTSAKSFGEMSIKELSNRDILLAQADSKYYKKTRDYLNLLNTPHANNFKESSKYLSRQAKKSAENAKYLDTYLERGARDAAAGRIVMWKPESDVRDRKGARAVAAGKYLYKNKDMTVGEAIKKVKRDERIKSRVEFGLVAGAAYAPLALVERKARDQYVSNYLKKHPKTRKSYNEIVRMYNTNYKL